jgi:hypothetical protein
MPDEKNHNGSAIPIAASVLLAIYVLLPVAIEVPLFAAEKHHGGLCRPNKAHHRSRSDL